MSKLNLLSKKEFLNLRSGQTVFVPKIDQYGKITILSYHFKGKKVKPAKVSIWATCATAPVFIFKCKSNQAFSQVMFPGAYLHFWTRKAAQRYADRVVAGEISDPRVHWVRRVRKQTTE